MKQLKNFTLKFVGVMIATIAFMLGFASCNDDATTDSTSFALYYTSMTDISPTMTGTIASPTYKGAEPSGFSITGVTFGDDNQPYTGDSFSIDETTGAVTFSNTSELQIGKYKISVSCIAGGKSYHFQDAIIVNFMKAVPDGITVEPAELLVEYADIINTEDQTIVLPTAQVKTDGNHISIKGYEISGIRKGGEVIENFPNPLFAISNTGEISIVKGNQSIEIGTYVLSLKLNTAVAGSDSEMGLFADAVKINVISKPLSLTYEPNSGKLEEVTTEPTSFRSQKPVLQGSVEGVNYSIESVTPEDGMEKISIDPMTGEIIVAEGHGFTKNHSYSISVRVKNQFSEEGVVFSDVFELNIVDFIEPIDLSTYNYTNNTGVQAIGFTIKKDEGFKGSEPKFELVNLKEEYIGQISIEPESGDISVIKDHNLSVGEHVISVKVRNDKEPDGVVKDITIKIDENPNYFTYVYYGNNLGENLSELKGDEYYHQFRFRTQDEYKANRNIKLIDSDIPQGRTVKWEIEYTDNMKSQSAQPTIDGSGNITTGRWSANIIGAYRIIVTVGGDDDPYSITRRFPVFIQYLNQNPEFEFTPFVFRVNPKTGGRFNALKIISQEVTKDNLLIDYQDTYSFFNLYGYRGGDYDDEYFDGRVDKTDGTGSEFLQNIWTNYGVSSFSTKTPVYYYNADGKVMSDLSKQLAYFDNSMTDNRHTLVVNAGKWCYDEEWADGLFIGKVSYTKTGDPTVLHGNGNVYPLIIWFDKDYTTEK